ncbi:hypothetical protein, partial [Salmonella enterica]|uniref:hypothetical protein n=1 Tax=Salmonella enterica TaxID=28901 RepID=UPI0020C55A94
LCTVPLQFIALETDLQRMGALLARVELEAVMGLEDAGSGPHAHVGIDAFQRGNERLPGLPGQHHLPVGTFLGWRGAVDA